jgi:hypothetical protein
LAFGVRLFGAFRPSSFQRLSTFFFPALAYALSNLSLSLDFFELVSGARIAPQGLMEGGSGIKRRTGGLRTSPHREDRGW